MEELQRQITELKAEIDSLKSSSTIPLEIGESMRVRLGAVEGQASGEATTTHKQAVDEAGTGTYDVAKPMDGFILLTIDGIARKIPYYN